MSFWVLMCSARPGCCSQCSPEMPFYEYSADNYSSEEIGIPKYLNLAPTSRERQLASALEVAEICSLVQVSIYENVMILNVVKGETYMEGVLPTENPQRGYSQWIEDLKQA